MLINGAVPQRPYPAASSDHFRVRFVSLLSRANAVHLDAIAGVHQTAISIITVAGIRRASRSALFYSGFRRST